MGLGLDHFATAEYVSLRDLFFHIFVDLFGQIICIDPVERVGKRDPTLLRVGEVEAHFHGCDAFRNGRSTSVGHGWVSLS